MTRPLCAFLVSIGLAACSSNGLDVGATSGNTIEGITGSFCGKQVTRMEDCKGDEILYVTIAETTGPVRYSGEVCEAFQKDCVPATFTEVIVTPASAKLTFEGKPGEPIKATLFPSTDKKTVRLVWDATATAPARDATLYRVGDIGGTTAKIVAGLTGEWCGKQVTRPADCQGDEALYLSIAEAANPIGYAGSICEAFDKQCVPLTFTEAVVTPASASFKFDGKPGITRTGKATPAADKKTLDIVVEPSASDPAIVKRLFRVGS